MVDLALDLVTEEAGRTLIVDTRLSFEDPAVREVSTIECQPMNQKPFDLTLIKFEDHDPPLPVSALSSIVVTYEHRRPRQNSSSQHVGSEQSEPSSTTGYKRGELLHRRLCRVKQFRGGVAKSGHLSAGRGCRSEKLLGFREIIRTSNLGSQGMQRV